MLTVNESNNDFKKQNLAPAIIFADSTIKNNSDNSSQVKTSDYESGESPTNSDYNSDTDKLNLKVIKSFGSLIENSISYIFLKDNQEIISYHHSICSQKLKKIKEEYNNGNPKNKENNRLIDESKKYFEDDLLWQTDDLKDLDLLNYLHDWNFPIFQFFEKSNHNVISQVIYLELKSIYFYLKIF